MGSSRTEFVTELSLAECASAFSKANGGGIRNTMGRAAASAAADGTPGGTFNPQNRPTDPSTGKLPDLATGHQLPSVRGPGPEVVMHVWDRQDSRLVSITSHCRLTDTMPTKVQVRKILSTFKKLDPALTIS